MPENLFLILHKVRGEPAFDVAQRIEHSFADEVDANEPPRDYIWIIPTSGHRAYPSWHAPLSLFGFRIIEGRWWLEVERATDNVMGDITYGLDLVPDHYAVNDALNRPAPVRRAPAPTTDDFLL